MASNMGYVSISELAESMKLEWSDAALADIDRFVEFLNREHPSLAGVVAGNPWQGASAVGTSNAGAADRRPGRVPTNCIAGPGGGLRLPISLRWKTSGDVACIPRERSARLKTPDAAFNSVASNWSKRPKKKPALPPAFVNCYPDRAISARLRALPLPAGQSCP